MRRRKSLALVALATVLSGCIVGPDGGSPPSSVVTEVPIPDGEHFGFVSVGTDESEAIVIGFDEAKLLHGEEARLAAIEAGVIEEGEDLPNDFFIVNEESVVELLTPDPSSQYTLISAENPDEKVMVNLTLLKSLYDGEDIGQQIYGIVPGTPFAMTVQIEKGAVARGDAVYLP